jgi:MFS family permease
VLLPSPSKFRLSPSTLSRYLLTFVIRRGWVQSSLNGANLWWPHEFGLCVDLNGPGTGSHDTWIFAAVGAVTYLSAAFVGCWLSDPLNEKLHGRRSALLVSALLTFVSVIGAAGARNWWELLICRIFLGMGMGAKASVVAIFVAETAPKNIRGSLVMCWQLFDAFGICLGFAANLAVSPLSDSWRWMVAAPFIPALILSILAFVCTESPRWLLKKGKYEEALRAWILLYGESAPILACREFYLTHVQIQSEIAYITGTRQNNRNPTLPATGTGTSSGIQQDPEAVQPRGTGGISRPGETYQQAFEQLTSYRTRLTQLWTVPRIRRAAVAASVVMIAQQTCGVSVSCGNMPSRHYPQTTFQNL